MFQSESLNLLISDSTATLRNVTHCLPSSTPIVFCLKKPGTTMIKITDDSKTWVRVGFYPWSKEKEQSKTRLWNSKVLDKLTALGPTANTSIRTWSGCLVHMKSICLSPNGSGIRENRQEVSHTGKKALALLWQSCMNKKRGRKGNKHILSSYCTTAGSTKVGPEHDLLTLR